MANLATGQQFPDFDLPADNGERVSSASLEGRPYVVFFYPKDDTSGCTLEALDFTARAGDFEKIGVSVFGVSPDAIDKHCRFRDKHSLSIPLLSDTELSLLQAAGVWVQKSMYGKTYMGVERTTALVDAKGVIQGVWPKVKVQDHAAEVLEEARCLSEASA